MYTETCNFYIVYDWINGKEEKAHLIGIRVLNSEKNKSAVEKCLQWDWISAKNGIVKFN